MNYLNEAIIRLEDRVSKLEKKDSHSINLHDQITKTYKIRSIWKYKGNRVIIQDIRTTPEGIYKIYYFFLDNDGIVKTDWQSLEAFNNYGIYGGFVTEDARIKDLKFHLLD